MRVVLVLLLSFSMLFVPQNVQAQTVAKPEVRFNAQTEHSRIVFDWGKSVGYKVQKKGKDRLHIRFDANVEQWSNRIPLDDLITNMQAVSRQPLTVEVEIQKGARVRDFSLGGRVVVDVYGKREKAVKATPPPKQPETKAKASPAPKKMSHPDAVPVEAVQQHDLPKQTILQQALATDIKPHRISLSSTDVIGLAAFVLKDHLWLVSDRKDQLSKPHMSGPTDKSFELQEVAIEGDGAAHKMKIPPGLNIGVSGGGILWRITVPDQKSEKKAITFNRIEDPYGKGSVLWPVKTARNILSVPHPVTGRLIQVVTVDTAEKFSGEHFDFVEFSVLPSPVGLAIIPKVDDLMVEKTLDGILISRTSGLSILPENQMKIVTTPNHNRQNGSHAEEIVQIFDFPNWAMGGEGVLQENKQVLLASFGGKDKENRNAGLLSLAKMYLSNGLWAEALGYLNFAQRDTPDLAEHNPEFVALKGAAEALAFRSKDAFTNLSSERLKPFTEVNYWRAYALADLGDWQQAKEVMPSSFHILSIYPPELATRLSLVLAEVSLRSGELTKAKELLDIAHHHEEHFKSEHGAAYAYLKGEYARQKGIDSETIGLWKPLVEGQDNLYRAKAGLALSRLLIAKNELQPAETIDTLERLRFAWRGDELETHIAYWLGKTYFEAAEYAKGLNIMREAASVPNTDFLRPRITADMTQAFVDLFLGEELMKTSPLEAFTVYEQFIELAPADERGNQIVQRLAEHLAKSDLLGRAAMLLQTQVDYRLSGSEIHRVGVKLAGIHLLNNNPDAAIAVLEKSLVSYNNAPPEYQTPQKKREISLLMARGMSQKGRVNEAVAFLEDMPSHPDVNRLRGDIAWRAGHWDDAATALGDIIIDQEVSLTRPLSKENRDLLLQRAVALNLAGDRIALANMRQKYSDSMTVTTKGKVFEVITRPRQSAALSDRETMLNIVSEVSLFNDFLESYRNLDSPTN